jgi:hypothetical protein
MLEKKRNRQKEVEIELTLQYMRTRPGGPASGECLMYYTDVAIFSRTEVYG